LHFHPLSIYLPAFKIIDTEFLQWPVLQAVLHCKEHDQQQSNTSSNHILFILKSKHQPYMFEVYNISCTAPISCSWRVSFFCPFPVKLHLPVTHEHCSRVERYLPSETHTNRTKQSWSTRSQREKSFLWGVSAITYNAHISTKQINNADIVSVLR